MGLLGGYRSLEGRNAAFRENKFPKRQCLEIGLSWNMGFVKGHLQKLGIKRGLVRRISVLMGVSGKTKA